MIVHAMLHGELEQVIAAFKKRLLYWDFSSKGDHMPAGGHEPQWLHSKVYAYIILATESISDTLSLSNVYIVCNFLASLACSRGPVIIHCSEVSSHCDVDRIDFCLLFILWESSWVSHKWLSWRKASAHSSKKLCMEVQASKNVPLSMPSLYMAVWRRSRGTPDISYFWTDVTGNIVHLHFTETAHIHGACVYVRAMQ